MRIYLLLGNNIDEIEKFRLYTQSLHSTFATCYLAKGIFTNGIAHKEITFILSVDYCSLLQS